MDVIRCGLSPAVPGGAGSAELQFRRTVPGIPQYPQGLHSLHIGFLTHEAMGQHQGTTLRNWSSAVPGAADAATF